MPLGIVTVDASLTVRTWDDWVARASGIPADEACGRPLASVVPSLVERGLLARFEQVLATGEAQVLSPAFHQYLIPCPPAEPSRHFDRMRQRVTLGALREQSRIVGVMASIEDVTAQLEAERALASALRSSDPLVRESAAAQVSAAARVDDPAAFADVLRDDDWKVRRAAVSGLARHVHRDMLASLLSALEAEHHDFNVLSSALQLLASSDVDVTGPLVELLQGEDHDLRIQAALALGEQHQPAAVPALIGALADPDVNVRFHAIEALGRLRAAEAVDALADIAEGDDFFLAFPAVDALARINDPRVAARLIPLLPRRDVGESAADALGSLGGAEVVRPLVDVVNATGPAIPVARALARLHERYEQRYGGGDYVTVEFQAALQPAGAQRLLDAVAEASPEDLRALVLVLGWLQGPAVERALTRLLGRPVVRADVIEAIVRQGAGIVTLLLEQLQAEDVEARMAAITALGRIGDRRATPGLVRVLDGDTAVVVAAASALARIGDLEAFEPLLPLLAHPDAAVRQAAIGALNSLGHPEMVTRISAMLESDDARARESAVRIAGYFGYRACVDALLDCCADPAEGVRRAAVEHAPFLDDPRVLPQMATALRDDTPKVRAAAAQALARVDGADAAALLLEATRDRDAWVRYYAVRALAERRAPRAFDRLAELAEGDGAMHVRLAALEGLGTLDGAAAIDILVRYSESEPAELGVAALRALGHVSDARAIEILKSALRSPDAARRLAAVEGLGAQPAVEAIGLLEWTAGADLEERVVRAAVDALASRARRADATGDAAAGALIAITAEAGTRDAATSALARLPATRVARVAAGLEHPDPQVRCAMIGALGRLRHSDASSAIRSALDDRDAGVREAAVTALDRLGVRGAAARLAHLARQDPSRSVRRAAAAALSRQTPDDRDGDA